MGYHGNQWRDLPQVKPRDLSIGKQVEVGTVITLGPYHRGYGPTGKIGIKG